MQIDPLVEQVSHLYSAKISEENHGALGNNARGVYIELLF